MGLDARVVNYIRTLYHEKLSTVGSLTCIIYLHASVLFLYVTAQRGAEGLHFSLKSHDFGKAAPRYAENGVPRPSFACLRVWDRD